MAISANSIITWADFATRCYNAMVSACCNIDSFKSVPARIQSGSARVAVKTISNIGTAGSESKWSATWYANPGNQISVVGSSTVSSEWNAFLSTAGINTRSNQLVKGKELGLAVALYMQFLSFHVKPVYARRQIYNTLETNSGIFQGMQYKPNSVVGTLSPYYKLSGSGAINPDTYDPVILAKNNYMLEGTTWAMFTAYDNPIHPYSYLN